MTTPAAPQVILGPGAMGPTSSNGRVAFSGGPFETPLGVPETASSYLEHLPGIYQESHFLGRFLLIFEHILSPMDRTAGNTWAYFDPGMAPAEFLPWLGSWVGLALDIRVPEENRREVVRAAPELFRWRGTKRGLREFIRLFTGIEPEIIEPTLSDIAGNRNLAYRFTVRMRIPVGSPIQRGYIETIVDAEKPAFAQATIEILDA